MARYPVTNIQFQAFLDAKDGYANDLWWKGLQNPDRTPMASTWTEPNHPRTDVSWYEAYSVLCLAGARAEAGRPATHGTGVGARRRWVRWKGVSVGDEYLPGYANIDETSDGTGLHYLRRTSAVGIYPQAASSDGVLDLAGNAWEWCLNEFDKPDRVGSKSQESRVLRGGSW